ncbi:MAG: UDP-N-acetylmuramate--L-alanine ligase [Lachnospiraceae bacterium]|nr:UDP-N-acetylmuramate--L-alanine ligase [Lachnospiraceae bacterium]
MYNLDFSKPLKIFFLGIGGISMSGLAEIMAHKGFKVYGSDRLKSDVTTHLEEKGITVYYGESRSHIADDYDLCVLTSAVKENNIEFTAIREKNIPYIYRADLLGQIMKQYPNSIAVSGTHGKTTTTSMVSEVLMANEEDPTLLVGGILDSIKGNVRIGNSPFLAAEACEYTNSFLSFFPSVEIILNVDEDHLDFFKDINDIRNSFTRFANLCNTSGCIIINADIPDYKEIVKDAKCKIITYGMNKVNSYGETNDYYPENISFSASGHPSFTMVSTKDNKKTDFELSLFGIHNISNTLSVCALSDFFNLDNEKTVKAINSFGGTKRRFEYKGTIGGVTVVDDYAHHPTEIAATLSAAEKVPHKTLWCVFQPHTYTRTKALMEDFASVLSKADKVVLADIYAARETDTLGISSETLAEHIRNLGKECYYFPSFDEIENFLLENCINGVLLITMGAGDVHKIGENILGI